MTSAYKQTAAYLESQTSVRPRVGIILGSGLGQLVHNISIEKQIPYSAIPGFPVSTVEGHDGNLIFGTIGSTPVVAMQGRFHYYEGYDMDQVVFPVRVMKYLGIEYLFVSNASGGLNPDFRTGDLMVITDHINFFPVNPLRGKNIDELGPRFPDCSKIYDKKLVAAALDIGKAKGIVLKTGIYIGSSGPTLETPAEYRMFRILGADVTGMSTVPEVIVAHHAGIKIFGISVVTNGIEPVSPDAITTHEEVNQNAAAAEPRMTAVFVELIKTL